MRALLLIAFLAVTACESDADKLQRLKGDRAVNCLLAQRYQREYDMVALQVRTPLQDSLTRITSEYDTKCELAERELNRFMR